MGITHVVTCDRCGNFDEFNSMVELYDNTAYCMVNFRHRAKAEEDDPDYYLCRHCYSLVIQKIKELVPRETS